MKNAVFLLLSALFATGCKVTNAVEFPVVGSNVAYAKVASLGFVDAHEKVLYGAHDSQFALLWRANNAQKKNKP